MDKEVLKTKDFPMSGLTEEMLFSGLSNSADNVYLFKTDLNNNYTIWSPNAVEYFGLSEGYETNVIDAWVPHVHPDDKVAYIKDVLQVLNGEKDTHYFQYRATNKENKYVWLECIGHVVSTLDKKKKFFVGMITRLDANGKYDGVSNCLSFQQFYLTKIDQPCSLLLLGLDGFRKVVNSLGYSESNKILFILGSILRRKFGQSNVFRMTGDEFLICLQQQSKEELDDTFKELQREFKTNCLENGFHISIGFSGGGALYNPDSNTKEDAIKFLEHALESSKQNGTEIFTMFSSAIEDRNIRYTKLRYALSNATKNDFKGFSIVYHPVMRSSDHQVEGFEMLLRFYDSELGNVSPVEFIPILEESGKIKAVGAWVAENAMRQKNKWDKIHPGLIIGFNISLKQLQTDELTNHILKLLDTYHIEPAEVAIELTESCKMDDPVYMVEVLTPLKERGVMIYLDDFGMEQSSFSMVKILPISGIKIDHSFVRTMLEETNKQAALANKAIVSSINSLGKMLSLRVVAEGVETKKIDEIMCDMNIQLLQGYYYSMPISAEQVESNWL